MGLSMFKSCYTSPTIITAPNPNPSRYFIMETEYFDNATVLVVKYKDCTNFEGVKVLVYKGVIELKQGQELDPHFQEQGLSPIARFRPDDEGLMLAKDFAINL